jgi:hypothetical protein
MSNSERLAKSIRSIALAVNELEKRIGNLDHPSTKALLRYQKGLSRIDQYSGRPQSDKSDNLVFGMAIDRMREMTVAIKKLEELVLEGLKRHQNESN